MHIVICGAGRVGLAIAQRLAAEKHRVTMVELSRRLARQVHDLYNVVCIAGHASHPSTLSEAGVEEADMIVAVTGSDETNMIACQVGHSLFGVPIKIAMIHDDSYLVPSARNLFAADQLPVDIVISPETELADSVLRRLAAPRAFEALELAGGRAMLLGLPCGSECTILRTSLRRISNLYPDLKAQIVGIRRGERLFVPGGDDELNIDDHAYCLTEADDARRVMDMFDHHEARAHRIVAIGGGRVGAGLAARFSGKRGHDSLQSRRMKLIEADFERAEELVERFPDIDIMHGDGMSLDLLHEAGIGGAHAIVTLTGDDRVNILAATRGKQEGCLRAIALVNDPTLAPLAHHLGVDSIVSPQSASISRILRETRHGRIHNLYSLDDGAAEIVEAEVLETSNLVGEAIGDLDLPEGLHIGAVIRDDDYILPVGETEFKAHDRAVIFVLEKDKEHIERMFRVNLEFF